MLLSILSQLKLCQILRSEKFYYLFTGSPRICCKWSINESLWVTLLSVLFRWIRKLLWIILKVRPTLFRNWRKFICHLAKTINPTHMQYEWLHYQWRRENLSYCFKAHLSKDRLVSLCHSFTTLSVSVCLVRDKSHCRKENKEEISLSQAAFPANFCGAMSLLTLGRSRYFKMPILLSAVHQIPAFSLLLQRFYWTLPFTNITSPSHGYMCQAILSHALLFYLLLGLFSLNTLPLKKHITYLLVINKESGQTKVYAFQTSLEG